MSLDRDEYAGFDIEYHDQHLFLTTRNQGVVVVDVRQASTPQIVGSLATKTTIAFLASAGRYLYMGSMLNANSVEIADLTDPGNPMLLGSARTKGQVISIAAGSSNLYATTTYGIEIFPLVPEN